ncbi:hypothetical protein [Microbacterium sp. CJ77]|uniref:hypothetical protein n=1 Tax=Microbacterium sp. CJ77 TaxID=2079201 RepID=UPI000CD97318|nr:hypothetical protein [Microbacterium sp. CJ77]
MKTVQLRTYTIVDGEFDAFLDWWKQWMPSVRAAAGFGIEFAYAVRESNQFVWAVSVEGDREAFLALERTYVASAERAAAFEGVPDRVSLSVVQLVEQLA